MKDQERSELAARVAEDLAQHQYTQLVNENGVEVWRCQQPGTRVYHFDICVTAYGMSMFGDIGGLIWNVGASYGINFLRHQSDGYLYEKLDESSRRQVIDFDSVRDTVCTCIVGRIEEEFGADQIPAWMAGIPDQGATLEQAEQLGEWLRERDESDDDRLPFSDLADVIEEVETFAEGRDAEIVLAYDFLHNNESLIGGSDLWETTISRPCPKVMASLYYVRHAASAIMAIKEQAAAA
ncbi:MULTISPECIES: hypothetical protein [unclassified Pseudomonas]|uniref:hypothetical protein n=1 Tax=unclassified Pseudomonas TaxID=196821 RepID=UPI0021BB4DBD|nr:MULTISPECIES: hypothetical protein [unclassified Pseudomonas]MCT8164976.1 hypothetical protein [Pseudomonas sp. HD6422]MCT8183874.1 hypothetical protein [Pseudomonas sp. HD6421]